MINRFGEIAGYTGTCLVPPAPFSLADGDVVTVAVAEIGSLTTGVVRGLDRMREAFGEPAPDVP